MKNNKKAILLMLSCISLSSVSHAQNTTKYTHPTPTPTFSDLPITHTREQWEQKKKAEQLKKQKITTVAKRLNIKEDAELNRRYAKLGEDRGSILLASQDPSIIEEITQKGSLSKLANLEKKLLDQVARKNDQRQKDWKQKYDNEQIDKPEYKRQSRKNETDYQAVSNDIRYILGRVADYYSDPEELE